MVTVVQQNSKTFVAAVTNADYRKFMGLEEMPRNFRSWQECGENGHGNPIFDYNEQYLFAAFGRKGITHATHRVVENEYGDYEFQRR